MRILLLFQCVLTIRLLFEFAQRDAHMDANNGRLF